MAEDEETPPILGGSFLATGRDLIDVADGTLTLKVQDEKVIFNVFYAIKHPMEKEDCF